MIYVSPNGRTIIAKILFEFFQLRRTQSLGKWASNTNSLPIHGFKPIQYTQIMSFPQISMDWWGFFPKNVASCSKLVSGTLSRDASKNLKNKNKRLLVGGFNPSENVSQIGSFPQVGVKIKNIWNHHLDSHLTWTAYPCHVMAITSPGKETWDDDLPLQKATSTGL